MTSYDSFLLDAVAFAHEAGKIQLQYFRKGNFDITAKQNDFDIVTTADKASEMAVKSGILSKYPLHHAILSEESGLSQSGSAQPEFEWVIDPLDGTTNFSAGLPNFNVSIGLRHHGQTVVGVVFAPYLNELFHAVKGEGAYLNGEPITTSKKTSLSQAVVATGFPYDKATTTDNNLDNVTRVMPQVRGLRRIGSAALDISYVAAGFLDGYWEINLHEWDVCAAELIATEAGATVCRFRTDRNVSLLAAAPGIESQLSALISTTPPQP